MAVGRWFPSSDTVPSPNVRRSYCYTTFIYVYSLLLATGDAERNSRVGGALDGRQSNEYGDVTRPRRQRGWWKRISKGTVRASRWNTTW